MAERNDVKLRTCKVCQAKLVLTAAELKAHAAQCNGKAA